MATSSPADSPSTAAGGRIGSQIDGRIAGRIGDLPHRIFGQFGRDFRQITRTVFEDDPERNPPPLPHAHSSREFRLIIFAGRVGL